MLQGFGFVWFSVGWLLVGLCQRAERPRRGAPEAPRGGLCAVVSLTFSEGSRTRCRMFLHCVMYSQCIIYISFTLGYIIFTLEIHCMNVNLHWFYIATM